MKKTDWSALQKLWENGEFVLIRAVPPSGSEARLLLIPASEQPSPATIRQLEYLNSLGTSLDSAWFVRPLAIVSQRGRSALLLEDPGGIVLGQRLAQPLELQLVLRVGIAVTSALGRLHALGFVHRNLNPDHVFVDFATGEVRLVGPYTTPRSPPEGFKALEPTGATLAFLAPEQTGRMNRSTDSRSDLYAYGVMLYRMLTGVLPFAANEAMEWIHCHLAIQPVPPNQRSKTVPAQLSAIVMKLLAKTPEERYQTAAGVEHDLKKCLESLAGGGEIMPFPLGMNDIPDEIVISDKLYGRDSQIGVLLTAYQQVVSDGKPALLLVSGQSGIGKSRLVDQSSNHFVTRGALFASGKFDQRRKNIPYTTVIQAFRDLVRQILSKSDRDVSQWRDRLVEALATNGQLISNLLPELELIIGRQPAVPDLPPQDAQNRFRITFRRFLGAFARAEHPLALFLDDLQWADTGTLHLIEHLLTEPELRHVLLIGAYRDDETSAFQKMIDKLRGTRVRVHEIHLAPLSREHVTQLIMDSLYAEADRARPLGQLIHEKTDGNPFFAIELLKALAQEKLLVNDADSAAWTWDVEQIRARRFTGDIAELVADNLDRLSDATLEILKQLACLGSNAPIPMISLLSGKSGEALDTLILEAVRAGLVSQLNGSIKFVHDRVQEAAYELIPKAERVSEHLRIGRLLLQHTPSNKIEEAAFEIVSQLNRAVPQITSAEERAKLVDLNLIAGKRARTAAAYVSALNYLAISSQLLGEDGWRTHYETSFQVNFNIAECELLTGESESADERLSQLSALAENPTDRAAVSSLRVILLTTLNRPERAVKVCLEYLASVGLACARNPTEQEVAQEYACIWSQLGGRTVEELVDLPPMTDPAARGALEVISTIVPPSWFTDENLRNLLVARMISLSLKCGNSEASCYAYALLARTLGSHFGDYEAGYRFGALSLELVEKRGLDRFKTRVYACFGHHIDPWKHHLRHSRKWLRLASAAAPQAGDLTFAAYNSANSVSNLLASGEPLIKVQIEAERGLEFARRLAFGLMVDLLTTQGAYIRALRGLTANLADFNDAEFSEKKFERHLDADPQLLAAKFRYWVRKLQAHYHAGDNHSAAAAAGKVQKLHWRTQSFVELAEYPFYAALALAGLYSSASAAEQVQHLETIMDHQKLLSTWAGNCSENFACMEALLAAEIARIQGRKLDAERLYEDSLNSARENGFIHNEGLANELAGKFYLGRGLRTVAYAYLRNARYAYLRWEALGKVRQLDQTYPDLTWEGMVSLPGEGVDGLDSVAVVKALQVISGEIVLDRLIRTLMRISVEYAGAERGLLLLFSDNELQIEAEAVTINGQVDVFLKKSDPDSSEGAPLSILQYVTRTRESVILEDASVRNLFSDDEYLHQRHPKSVLCLPITRQDEVVGVLYLENNLTTHAFTSYRIHVLRLLASQAAISLENAHLYNDLKKSEQKLTASEQVARGQAEALMYSLDVLATASEPERFLAKMLSTVCRLLGGQSTALWLYDQGTESIFLRLAVNSVGPLDFDRDRLLKQNEPSWGKNTGFQELLCEGFPILCEDTATDPRVNSEMRDYFSFTGTKKFLAVPILAEGHVRGMISVWHAERSPYRTEEVELAQALAHQVMLAIRLTEIGEQNRKAAVLAERNRMARDVHDTLAQGFTGVIVQLEAAEYAISEGDREDANRHLRKAGELARRSLSEARRSVHALRPQALEQANFWEALKSMAKSTTVGTTLQTRFEAKGGLPVLPPSWQENLLRIGQEALSNTLKYARAKQFRTRLISNDKKFRLEFCDDGEGFRVGERHDGVGVIGMRERAEEMGGEFKIVSSPGKGTRITVVLSLEPASLTNL